MNKDTINFVTCGYNCEKYVHKCIGSVLSQNNPNWHMHILDDASTDNTLHYIKNIVAGLHPEIRKKFNLYQNTSNKRALCNLNTLIRNYCEDDSVIAILDLDDWLYHSEVVDIALENFKDENLWVAWTKFINSPANTFLGVDGFSRAAPPGKSLRNKYNWCFGPTRMFRKWLYDMVNEADLKDKDGNFYSTTYDVAMMLPMLEMAGEHRCRFVPNVTYVYNVEQSHHNDFKVNRTVQLQNEAALFAKPPYKEIE